MTSAAAWWLLFATDLADLLLAAGSNTRNQYAKSARSVAKKHWAGEIKKSESALICVICGYKRPCRVVYNGPFQLHPPKSSTFTSASLRIYAHISVENRKKEVLGQALAEQFLFWNAIAPRSLYLRGET